MQIASASFAETVFIPNTIFFSLKNPACQAERPVAGETRSDILCDPWRPPIAIKSGNSEHLEVIHTEFQAERLIVPECGMLALFDIAFNKRHPPDELKGPTLQICGGA